MKKKTGFKKIRTRLTLWFFLAAMLPLSLACVIIYFQGVEALQATEFNKLAAIRDLKVNALQEWIDGRKGDTVSISEDSDARTLEFLRSEAPRSLQESVSLVHVRESLNNTLKNYDSYSELFLIDPLGMIVVSTEKNNEGLDKNLFPYFNVPMLTDETHIQDIYYSKELRRNAMTFSRPVFCSQHNRQHLLGVMVLRIDLEQSLYPLLLNRAGIGRTGETLIVNKDAIALNELRWYPKAPLKLRIKAEPATKAAKGETGILETIDYRGEPVLAAFTYISDTGWGFVTKQDLAELYARTNVLFREVSIIFITSMIGSYILALTLSRFFTTPLLKVTEAAKKIEAGDLQVRIKKEGDDEFGVLARAFNRMAESLEGQVRLQNQIGSLNEILVNQTEIRTFGQQIIEQLMDDTRSAFGAFYLLDQETKNFTSVYSLGFDEKSLESLDSGVIKGAFSHACSTGKISCLQDISRDTVFAINTLAGAAIPRSIVTIPILIKGQVGGVISLGSLIEYSDESKELLNRIHAGMNTGISNILAGEEAKELTWILNDKNIELEGQTTELHATAEELQKQNRELATQRRQVEEASKLKSEFLSNMSHELRTPLNSVLALSSVLGMQAGDKLNEEENGYIKVIERNGRQLLNLINDILDLSKIEAGRMDITVEIFPPKVTIDNILDSIEPLCKEKGLALNVNLPTDLPHIKSDERKIHHIVQNLLSNAVKFTEKGEVSVSARFDGQSFCVDVTDTGIGISEANLSQIFKEFKQIDGSTTRRYDGTGLGLAIAHKAVRLLGGDLTVTSVLGKGSTFSLTLPLIWTGHVSGSAQSMESFAPATEEDSILVVDDDPLVTNLIAEFLTTEGYKVLTALTGKRALELAEKEKPFAITLDLMMPEMDGWEVLQNLKSSPKTASIPVLIVSVSEDRETGFALGALGHLTKPFENNQLLDEIKRLCLRPYSLLVVDDNDLDRDRIIKIVEKENIKTLAASNGREGMALIQKTKPDILVLDLMMPEMDGFEMLKRLRTDPATMCLPVIVVTAKDLTEEEKTRLNLHVVSVFSKNKMSQQGLLEEVREQLSKLKRPPLPASCKMKKKGDRILVVEDNRSSVIQIQRTLEKEGYVVDVARGGQEAIDFVQHTIPDGIIMDLMMPEVDGFEVLEKIRSSKETEAIPVLVLTAKDLTEEDFSRLSANHISQLVQKGDVRREDLLLKVNMMLGNRENPPAHVEKGVLQNNSEGEGKLAEIKIKVGERPRILVIEDNPDNMLTVNAILKKDYTVLEAFDGEKGLEMAGQDLPALIFLDISLPKMDGYEVIKKIRSDRTLKHIPVIALTAHAMKGDRTRILEAGFDDVISKPIVPDKMLERLKRIFVY